MSVQPDRIFFQLYFNIRSCWRFVNYNFAFFKFLSIHDFLLPRKDVIMSVIYPFDLLNISLIFRKVL